MASCCMLKLLAVLLMTCSLNVIVTSTGTAAAEGTVTTSVDNDHVDDVNIEVLNVGVMTASFPWLFGPYQSQMHQLSLLLHQHHNHHNNHTSSSRSSSSTTTENAIRYKIHWLCHSFNIPPGEYISYQQLKPHLGNTIPPPPSFPLSHLTFIGNTAKDPSSGQMTTSSLNKLARKYNLHSIITLMDNNKVIPDADMDLPLIAWVPLHTQTVPKTSVDYWFLRSHHGIAGLAPSTTKIIQDAVSQPMDFSPTTSTSKIISPTIQVLQQMYGEVQVQFIPHILSRQIINEAADKGLNLLQKFSVAKADSILDNAPIINRGQEHTLIPTNPNSIFGSQSNKQHDFIILLQGGNYENQDRKGWDTSIQAFARFYKTLYNISDTTTSSNITTSSSTTPPINIHLLIHSMESYLLASDQHSNADAPPNVLPIGTMIQLALHNAGIPKSIYTLDIAKHASPIVAAYKKRASICLHPSKVEGFGMNVIECQAVGTPVITTHYTAMADFTFIGKSVPHLQMISSPGVPYDMAMPHVDGIAHALMDLYNQHVSIVLDNDAQAIQERNQQIQEFQTWIDQTCSNDNVQAQFHALITSSRLEFQRRKAAKERLMELTHDGESLPTEGAYRIASGYHSPIVDWDTPWTLLAPDGLEIINPQVVHQHAWKMLLSSSSSQSSTSSSSSSPPLLLILPAKYENGQSIPFMNPKTQTINDDLPIFVRTFMLTALQQQMSRRKSLVASAINNIQQQRQSPGMLPGDLAIIHRRSNEEEGDVVMVRDEL